MCNLINTHTHTQHKHKYRVVDGDRRRGHDENGDRNEDSRGDGNEDEDSGNENRIGEGGREAKKRKKPQNSRGDLGGKRKKMYTRKVWSSSCQLR